MHTPTLEIDLHALKHNLQRVRDFAPNSKVMAMIKANAYGHGVMACAKALQDADGFGVARLEEAIALREAGVNALTLVMCGPMDPSELPIYQAHDISVLVHLPEHLEMLEHFDGDKIFDVWLKIDTGMRRLGFAVDQAKAAYDRLKACRAVKSIRLMSHCVVPERIDNPMTQQQLDAFLSVVKDLPEEKSFAKSAAIMAWPQSQFDWVRPGIMLYGISPFPNRSAESLGLLPVMTLRTTLVRVDQRKKGDNLGYGGEIQCPDDMPIGIIAAGYADGYPRHLITPAPIIVNGKRCQTIARIAMDLMMVDLRHAPDAKRGDEVILWGRDLPIEEVAKAANTIPYTLITAVTPRVRRTLVDQEGG
jgi:alanine racemase